MNPQSIELALILSNLVVNANQATSGHETKDSNHNGKFSGLLNQALQPKKGLRLPGGKNGTMTERTGLSWLERFQNRLKSSGIPLKEMSLSRKALTDLKKILTAEGYSESQITNLFEKLLHGKQGYEIKVTELIERLAELKALSDRKSSDPVLETSAIPYLEASLRRLGLDHQEVNRAMEGAMTEGGRLNLKTLVRNLKAILRALPEGNQPGADGKAAEDIKGMLARVGIIAEGGNIDGPVSLERFVRILEQRVASLTPHSLSKTEMEKHVKGLLDKVLVSKKETGGKSSAESLSDSKLKVFPDNDSKVNGPLKEKILPDNDSKGNRPLKEIAEGLKNSASQEKRAGAGMEKLIEAVQGAHGKKATDQDKVTSPHWVREAIIDRGNAPDAITTKQGARPFPLYVVNQVARQISLSLQRGENSLRIQLRPPQLGAVQIDMDMKDSVLKIGMTTENNSVKEFLVSSIQELRDSLVQQGVKLERLDVQVNYNLGESMAQARRGQNGFQRQRQGQRGGLGETAGSRDVSEIAMQRIIRADALVDLVA